MSSNTSQASTDTTPAQRRAALMRRHGLKVDDTRLDTIVVELDIPYESSSTKLVVIDWLIAKIEGRIITQEFCNSRGPQKDGHIRVDIEVSVREGETNKETPNAVYMFLRDEFLSVRDRLRAREANGEVIGEIQRMEDAAKDPEAFGSSWILGRIKG
ncbi:hypothetical protein BDV18DRAFT_157086 [Aspergillus unguis]